jgi:predicted phosphoribosyltransferase
MYFHSRTDAGEMLAERLMQYRYENAIVVALGQGAVVVGAPVAERLHCALGLFLSEEIAAPGENQNIGTVSQGGGFVYNKGLSEGETEDYYSELHGYMDDQKREKTSQINRLLADGGSLDINLLREHVVILISDGLQTSSTLEAAAEFLKPVKTKRLVIAAPVASVAAVDRMHILADELHCLSVTDNYIETAHYYDVDDVPTHDQAVKIINNVVLNWR